MDTGDIFILDAFCLAAGFCIGIAYGLVSLTLLLIAGFLLTPM